MSGLKYTYDEGEEGNENSAVDGNTLFVVWDRVKTMEAEQFSCFITSDEEVNEEAKVEMGDGRIVRVEEGVSGGGSGEMKRVAVCAQIGMGSESVGRVAVSVMEEEEMREEGCGVEMGSELTRIVQQCEDLQIVINMSQHLYCPYDNG